MSDYTNPPSGERHQGAAGGPQGPYGGPPQGPGYPGQGQPGQGHPEQYQPQQGPQYGPGPQQGAGSLWPQPGSPDYPQNSQQGGYQQGAPGNYQGGPQQGGYQQGGYEQGNYPPGGQPPYGVSRRRSSGSRSQRRSAAS